MIADGNKDNSINKILDKSFVLPIYERNFDKINQLVKSDFNNNILYSRKDLNND